MKRRLLGKTGFEVSEIGFGGWAIGGNEHGNSLGPTDDASSRAAIDAAIAEGITFFDTADVYGHGRSERLLGEALSASGARAGVVIATKAGADVSNPAAVRKRYDPPYLREALSRSLERLGTDHVDLFQLHDPPVAAIRSAETREGLVRLREEGLARATGVSIHTLEEGLAALEHPVYETIQLVLNVATQWVANRLLEPARARGVGVIAREPLAQGFLAGKYAKDHAFSKGDVRAGWTPQHRGYLSDVAERMRGYFHVKHGLERPLAAIAIQFALAFDSVSTVIASMKAPDQVRENARVTDLPPLTRAHLAWLRE